MTDSADERAPLLPTVDGLSSATAPPEQTRMPINKRSLWMKLINPRLTRHPWRLFEILDFRVLVEFNSGQANSDNNSIPGFIRHRCQAILTSAWIHKVPPLQKISPAELAASIILRTLEEDIGDLDTSKTSVIDFCSGAGGPIPTIERIVNAKRREQGKKPIPFVMSDLHPNLDEWMEVCARSKAAALSFIPQSVDATDPPVSATSTSAPNSRTEEGYRSDTRVFRLYCLSFHHFGDKMARKVLESTMATADGFAIIELQDRYLSSLLLMLGHLPLIFLTSWWRYWRDVLMLVLVYLAPIVPVVNTYDGVVSSLRTRNFKEVMKLVGAKMQERKGEEKVATKGDWVFRSRYEMHSWPVGYMNWIVGYKRRKQTNSSETTTEATA